MGVGVPGCSTLGMSSYRLEKPCALGPTENRHAKNDSNVHRLRVSHSSARWAGIPNQQDKASGGGKTTCCIVKLLHMDRGFGVLTVLSGSLIMCSSVLVYGTQQQGITNSRNPVSRLLERNAKAVPSKVLELIS